MPRNEGTIHDVPDEFVVRVSTIEGRMRRDEGPSARVPRDNNQKSCAIYPSSRRTASNNNNSPGSWNIITTSSLDTWTSNECRRPSQQETHRICTIGSRTYHSPHPRRHHESQLRSSQACSRGSATMPRHIMMGAQTTPSAML